MDPDRQADCWPHTSTRSTSADQKDPRLHTRVMGGREVDGTAHHPLFCVVGKNKSADGNLIPDVVIVRALNLQTIIGIEVGQGRFRNSRSERGVWTPATVMPDELVDYKRSSCPDRIFADQKVDTCETGA